MRPWGFRTSTPSSLIVASVVVALIASALPAYPLEQRHQESLGVTACERWVATTGDDTDAGTRSAPWASLQHAVDSIPDRGCTVTVLPGIYRGGVDISRRFTNGLLLRASEAQRSVLEHSSTVVDLDGALNVVVEGFELRHSGPGSEGFIISVDRGPGGVWSENVALTNNLIHDSYSNDLLKIHAGVRGAVVAGNMFYNQGASEQHIDVNSVMDVVIQENVFFNDFDRSGRKAGGTKHFIVVKDSGRADDGIEGSRRITIRRNVFMNWEGGREAFVRVGNDGKAYHEAIDVQIENNLFIANSSFDFDAPLGVSGAKRVTFVNNTIVGDLGVGAFGFRAQSKGKNPKNEDLIVSNNLWADPDGTMVRFTTGDPRDTTGLVLDSNLYWNDGEEIPSGRVVSPGDDLNAQLGDPGLADVGDLATPIWNGRSFASGSTSIRAEFVRLVRAHAAVAAGGPTIDTANEDCAPATDILARYRHQAADIGAWEASSQPADTVVAGPSATIYPLYPSAIPGIIAAVHFGCRETTPNDLLYFCDPSANSSTGELPRLQCVM